MPEPDYVPLSSKQGYFTPYSGQYHFKLTGPNSRPPRGSLGLLLEAFLETSTSGLPKSIVAAPDIEDEGRFKKFEKLFLTRLANAGRKAHQAPTPFRAEPSFDHNRSGSQALVAVDGLIEALLEDDLPRPTPLPSLLSAGLEYGAIRSQVFEDALGDQIKELAEYLAPTN